MTRFSSTRGASLILALLFLGIVCARADYRVRAQALVSVQSLARGLAAESSDITPSMFVQWPHIHHVVVVGEHGQVVGSYSNPALNSRPDAVVKEVGKSRSVEVGVDLPAYQAMKVEFPLWALCLICLAIVMPGRLVQSEPEDVIWAGTNLPRKGPGTVVLELDSDLRIQRASRGVESFGHDPVDLVGRPVGEFVEKFQPDQGKTVREVRERGGRRVDSIVSSASVSDTAGMKTLIVTLSQPATSDSDGLQSRYRQLEEICDTVCDNAREAIFVVDASATLLYGNRSSLRATGHEYLLGRSLLEMVTPRHRFPFADALELALNQGFAGTFEFELVDQEQALWEGSFHSVGRATEGEWGLAIGIFRDVSEARQLSQELERSRERLSHSQKIEALGRMAGGVAHDFNNLLTTMNINLEAVENGLPQKSLVKPYLEEIRIAVVQAVNVTRQLLLYSRKKPLEPKRICCHQVVRNTVRLASSFMGRTSIELGLRARQHFVLLEEGQLDQVLLNLLMNAKDSLGDGGTISIESRDTDHTFSISVRDDGPGIPAELRSKVFEPYFTTKPPGKGTGLGLSTGSAIMEKAGGSLTLRSRPGETIFELSLPLFQGLDRTFDSSVETLSKQAVKDRRVMLVEDEKGIRVLLSRILQERQFQVTTAEDATRASSLLNSEESFDLLITDLVLPGASGTELAREFRRVFPEVLVLYMSGFPGDAFEDTALGSHDRFLAKPFSQEQFIAAVDDLLLGARN